MTAPEDTDGVWLGVQDQGSVGSVRRSATRLGQTVGLPDGRVGDLAVVASELGSNLYKHAQDGVALVRVVRRGPYTGVEIVAIDRGPGMADVGRSSMDGHSTSGTLGIGLGAVARMSSEFDFYSLPGQGTVIVATIWANLRPSASAAPSGAGPPVGSALPDGGGLVARGISRPMSGEEVTGDGYGARVTGTGRFQVMLCDGLGHGPLAAIAARAAEAAFRSAPDGRPKEVLEHLHHSLHHTRGAVATVVEIDQAAGRASYAGLGNISGAIVDNGQRRMLTPQPGIAGGQRQNIRELELPCPATATVVLHSDGVTDKWSVANYPGLFSRTPLVVAATLLRDASVRRDDAAVLVARAGAGS